MWFLESIFQTGSTYKFYCIILWHLIVVYTQLSLTSLPGSFVYIFMGLSFFSERKESKQNKIKQKPCTLYPWVFSECHNAPEKPEAVILIPVTFKLVHKIERQNKQSYSRSPALFYKLYKMSFNFSMFSSLWRWIFFVLNIPIVCISNRSLSTNSWKGSQKRKGDDEMESVQLQEELLTKVEYYKRLTSLSYPSVSHFSSYLFHIDTGLRCVTCVW